MKSVTICSGEDSFLLARTLLPDVQPITYLGMDIDGERKCARDVAVTRLANLLGQRDHPTLYLSPSNLSVDNQYFFYWSE